MICQSLMRVLELFIDTGAEHYDRRLLLAQTAAKNSIFMSRLHELLAKATHFNSTCAASR